MSSFIKAKSLFGFTSKFPIFFLPVIEIHGPRQSSAPCLDSLCCTRRSLQPRSIWQSAPQRYRYHQTHHKSKLFAPPESVLCREEPAVRRVPLQVLPLLPQTIHWPVSGPINFQEHIHTRHSRPYHRWLSPRIPHHLAETA